MIQYPLKEKRKQLGISRRALADAIGVSVYAVKGWETMTRTPSSDNLYKIQLFFMNPALYLDKVDKS